MYLLTFMAISFEYVIRCRNTLKYIQIIVYTFLLKAVYLKIVITVKQLLLIKPKCIVK